MVDSHQAFKYQWSVWRLTGIQVPNHINRRVYYCYAIILNLSVTILFPLTLFINLFFAHNMAQLFENLVICVTDGIANFKFAYVWHAKPKLLRIREILQQLDTRAKHKDEKISLEIAVRTAHQIFLTFSLLYGIGILLSVIKMLLTRERCLLYPAWFYFDWQQSSQIYACACLYQFFGLIVQAVQNCANDSYPPAYLCILTAHMRALELRVRRLGQTNQRRRELTQQELHDNYVELLACIKDHILILKLYSIINDLLSISCLAQFIFTVVLECFLGLHFLYVIDAHDRCAQLLSIIFFIAITLEVFVLCYFGDIMLEQNAVLTDAFYSCNWIDQTTSFKRVLLISMMRTQKDCFVRAGNYIPVDLNTFLKLMKYAYSAFTLLIRFK